jgi:hypothetical protein
MSIPPTDLGYLLKDVFTEEHKFVISGVLDRWENEQSFPDPAIELHKVFDSLFQENWNFVLYDGFDEEQSGGAGFLYHKKWSVFGIFTSGCPVDAAELRELLDKEFGWGTVAHTQRLQSAIIRRVDGAIWWYLESSHRQACGRSHSV